MRLTPMVSLTKQFSLMHLVGSKGRPKELKVPPGITVIDVTESRVIGELNKKGDKLIVARGGKGGGPQNRFIGERIKPRLIQLDLKLLADIGFVGFPNAGKSTLLKALSRADPAISPRPFTTLKPQLGTVIFDDHEYQDSMLTIADLPGLIEGAHKNVGLGYEFLKHIERTLLLMFVIDIHGFQFLPTDPYRTAFETILLLNKEIELYNPDLLLKPAILCLNKTDSDPSGQKTRALIEQIQEAESLVYSLPAELRPQRLLKFDGIFPICAKDRTSINELKLKLRSVVDYCQQLRLEERETRPDLALNSAEIFQ